MVPLHWHAVSKSFPHSLPLSVKTCRQVVWCTRIVETGHETATVPWLVLFLRSCFLFDCVPAIPTNLSLASNTIPVSAAPDSPKSSFHGKQDHAGLRNEALCVHKNNRVDSWPLDVDDNLCFIHYHAPVRRIFRC